MSSRDLAKSLNRNHGHIRQIIRDAVKSGAINMPSECDWVCSQNGNIYQEYIINESDALAIINFDKSRQPKNIKKRSIPKLVRNAVFENDNFTCVSCGSTEDVCIDHIIPECRGGTRTADNLQTLCRSCNSSKGTKTMIEWLGVSV